MKSTSLCRLAAFAAVGLLASTASARAQSAVKIDFRVVGDDGRPVPDLKASEVTMRVGGKAREIRSLDLVRTAPAGAAAARPDAPPFATNTADAAPGRTILMLVDDESLAPGRDTTLKAALARVVAALGPGDRAGLISVRRTGGINIAPTADRAALTAAIEKISGYSSSEAADAFRCRTLGALQALEAVFAGATGPAPVTMVFFSASLAQPGESMARIGRASDLCRLVSEDFERTGTAAAASRTQIYVVQVVEGTTMIPADASAGIESLAGVTGAETMRMTGNGDAIVDRILRETSAYYVASFEPDPGDRNGASQRVELRVAREGVTVRARSGLTLPRADARGSGKATPRDMIRVATVYSDLPLRAAGYASRNPGDDKLRVIALFEPADASAKLTAASVGLFAADGRLTSQWTAQEPDLARTPPMAALTAPKGTYRMRVAAVDASGRSGTVDYSLVADMAAAGPLQLSTMMLGMAEKGFAPKLQFVPGDSQAVGYLEVYGVPKGSTVTATLELAPTETGGAIATTPAQVGPGATEDGRLVFGGFAIGALPPGDVVMRATISLDGKVVGRAVRTLRKAQ